METVKSDPAIGQFCHLYLTDKTQLFCENYIFSNFDAKVIFDPIPLH